MTITPLAVIRAVGLKHSGSARWGVPIDERGPGIYFVSTSRSPLAAPRRLASVPICAKRTAAWIERTPVMKLDGRRPSSGRALGQFLAGFWLPGETILYIGKATSLKRRLAQFAKHRLGDRSPHAGGHWLKTLTCLDRLWVHYARCATAKSAANLERDALEVFARRVSSKSNHGEQPPTATVPFANRVFRKQTEKRRLRGQVRPR